MSTRTLGPLLIGAGLFLILRNYGVIGGNIFVLIIGLAALAAYFLSHRSRPLLVLGCLATGLGAGLALQGSVYLPGRWDGVAVLLGLAAGFLLMYLLAPWRPRSALIIGVVLLAAGLLNAGIGRIGWTYSIAYLRLPIGLRQVILPVLLMATGLLLLLRRSSGRS